MRVLDANLDIEGYIERIAVAKQRALLMDYDGTLSPFQVERDKSIPYEGVAEELQTILDNGRSRVVIISGRSIRDLIPLLPFRPLPELWGSHGWERRLVDGTYEGPDLPYSAAQGLSNASDWMRLHGLLERCEEKPACLAVHWRGLVLRDAQCIRRLVRTELRPLAKKAGLAMKPFDGGIELVVPGKDKGMAVQSVLNELSAGTIVAYLGDDFTDEDAFEAIKGHGLGMYESRQVCKSYSWSTSAFLTSS